VSVLDQEDEDVLLTMIDLLSDKKGGDDDDGED
jgi:hypothetical protein